MGLSGRSGCSYAEAVSVVEAFIQVQALQDVVELHAEAMASEGFAVLKHE